MAKFSYVNKEKQLVEFSFNDIKPENPINDFIQNNSVDDSYDFDELTTNGIYLFQNISKINNEVKHRPAALAGSGQLFFFSEEPSKANRIVFQLVFSDSDESKLHYRRGMANSAGLQFEEWQSTSRSMEAASNFAISKVSPASIVGGSWIKNSSVPASMVWEHSGVSTYVDGQTSGMNVLLNLETFALSASQEVYIKESGAFQKMTLGIGCGGTGSTTAEDARNALGAASQTDLNSLRDSVSDRVQIAWGLSKCEVVQNYADIHNDIQFTSLKDGINKRILSIHDKGLEFYEVINEEPILKWQATLRYNI